MAGAGDLGLWELSELAPLAKMHSPVKSCLLNKGENGEDGDICGEAVRFIRYMQVWGRST